MTDLTKNSIAKHILTMAAPMAIIMLAQLAYQLVDLYFVTKLGVAATAGVNAAGNSLLGVAALIQVLGVGTVALIAHAIGRKDGATANLIFNQSLMLSAVLGFAMMVLTCAFIRTYMRSLTADAATVNAGATFIFWVSPGYALALPMAVFSYSLRAVGIVRPTIAIHMLTVIVNALLAPVLIAGWGIGVPLGVKGAGLATSISIAVGVVALGVYFHRVQRHMGVQPELIRPQLKQWRRVLAIGLPAGGEYTITFLSAAVVYYTIQDMGSAAQAGFGIGSRVLQTILLPGVAIAMAAAPIAGQNFGANNNRRVREVFHQATLVGSAVMIATTLLVQWHATALLGIFDNDAAAVSVATDFLRIQSWTFVAQGLVLTCSSMFQGLGNTVPALISSGTRFLVFAVPAVWLSLQPGFRIEQVWYLLLVSVILQATVSLCLLRMEFRKRLSE